MGQTRRPVVSAELLERETHNVELSGSYLVLMGLGGVLGATALLATSVPVLVGAMIIAPAFPPLSLVALALTARQPRLIWKGCWIAAVGLVLVILAAMATTLLLNWTNVIPPQSNLLEKPLLEERVRPNWSSVIIAVAAGFTGMMAVVKDKIDTVIGTVAALALVPAAAAAGVAFLSRDPSRGWGGLSLLAINVGAVVVTGVITLLVLRPGEHAENNPPG